MDERSQLRLPASFLCPLLRRAGETKSDLVSWQLLLLLLLLLLLVLFVLRHKTMIWLGSMLMEKVSLLAGSTEGGIFLSKVSMDPWRFRTLMVGSFDGVLNRTGDAPTFTVRF